MNKTILRLDKEVSIMILSLIMIFFTFISSYYPVNGIVSFLFVLVKTIVFVIVPFIFYVLENKNYEFKKIAGIYSSYSIINLFVTVVVSFSIVNGEISGIFSFLFYLVNLVILLSSIFIFIEQVMEYSQIKNKVYAFTIMKIVYTVANFVSYPFTKYVFKKFYKNDLNE